VVTVLSGEPVVQVTKPGETLTLLADVDGESAKPEARQVPTVSAREKTAEPPRQVALFSTLVTNAKTAKEALFAHGPAETTPLVEAFELDAQSPPKRYARRPGVPSELVTEALPEVPDNFEERLVTHIDFTPVLGDRLRVRSLVVERMTDLFAADKVEDKDVYANVSPVAIAERARQLAFQFDDVDRRAFLSALKQRFLEALISRGHEPPSTEEDLTRQLELVLVRNPRLIKEAYKRVRAEQVQRRSVHIRDALESEFPLEPAARNVYGVFPPDLKPEEKTFAEVLDTSSDVLWWHRNPVKKPDSVALYKWSEGIGFFPDFVVGIAGRTEGNGAALTEVKGPHLLDYDRDKAGAVHPVYGRVFMVGREIEGSDYRLWRLAASGQLVDDGPFEVRRLRYS
jgi:hypothetical protein